MPTTPSPNDEQLLTMVRAARPSMPVAPSGAADELLRRIIATDRGPGGAPARPAHGSPRLRLGAASLAATAAAIVVLSLLGSDGGSGVAFARWTAKPTAATGGQLADATTECRKNAALRQATPVLSDSRGPYSLLVFADHGGSACVTGPELGSPSGEPPVIPFGSFLAASAEADRRANGGGSAPQSALLPAPGEVRSAIGGNAVTRSSQPGAAFSLDVGRTGAGVSALTLKLSDGSAVTATVSDGWFAAWWPGGKPPVSAEVTTPGGVRTQQLGRGSGPAEAAHTK